MKLVRKTMLAAIDTLTETLGGNKVFHKSMLDENEIVEKIRLGLPVAAIDALMDGVNLTAEELVGPLGISLSTIKRRHKQERLSASVSDRLFRVAKIVALATEILGNREKASRWMHKANRSLSGDTPLSRLDTSIGFSQVEEILMRIEHGLFS